MKEDKHGDSCTTNINMQNSIGNEERWSRDGFEELKEVILQVSEVIANPDRSDYRVAELFF